RHQPAQDPIQAPRVPELAAARCAAAVRGRFVSTDAGEVLIEVKDLAKTFHIGLFKKRVDAVKGVSFNVRRGEIFGFLGPNGAGKTTTIKMLTGLIAPTSGEAFLFGARVPSPEARRRIGFLPENPYVYPYLTPREFVELCGRLSGLGGAALAK